MTDSSRRRVFLLSGLLLAVMLATAADAANDPLKAARACRQETAKKLAKLAGASFKAADTCHKKRNACRKNDPKCAGAAAANCNALPIALGAPDAAALTKKCPTPVLAGLFYPDDLVQQLATVTATQVHTSGAVIQGNSNLADDSKDDADKQRKKQNRKCHDTIGRERTKLAKKILANAIKCQNEADKTEDVFGPRDAFCATSPTVGELQTAAQQKIVKACTRPAKSGGAPITPEEVGSCTKNFPACVTDPSVITAEALADDAYTLVSSCSPVLQSTSRSVYQIIRRFFRISQFGKQVSKIPPFLKGKKVRANPIGRVAEPAPSVAVNRSPFHPGGGRSMQVTIPSSATANHRLGSASPPAPTAVTPRSSRSTWLSSQRRPSSAPVAQGSRSWTSRSSSSRPAMSLTS